MKRNLKRLIIIALATVAVLGGSCVAVASEKYLYTKSSLQGIVEEGQETRADRIGWVFKVVDGKVYRRLYNYSTGEYLTDWELVG